MTATLAGALLTIGSSTALSVAVKATAIAGMAVIAAHVARRSRASIRHLIYAGTLGVLLLLPVWSLVGPALDVEVATSTSRTPRYDPVALDVPAGDPRARVAARTVDAPEPGSPLSLSALARGAWAAGMLLVLIPAGVGLWQALRIRRSATPWEDETAVAGVMAAEMGVGRPVDVLLHERVAGPMTCGFARPAIVLPLDARGWADQERQHAIQHELEHVRRGDWLVHCAARLVCAMYWFHPLVWLCARRLALEAERACDDGVLRHADAAAYAQQLVGLARRLAAGGRGPLLAMANGDDLTTRVRAVLDGAQARGRAGRAALAAAVATSVFVMATISPLRTVATAQARASGPDARPVFDAASIKPSESSAGMIGGQCAGTEPQTTPRLFEAARVKVEPIPPGVCAFTRTTLRLLIFEAYGIGGLLGGDEALAGGPAWLDRDRFDIRAKAVQPVPRAELRLMLQRLLEDRFGLRMHPETRRVDGFALVVTSNGSKMQRATGQETRRGITRTGNEPFAGSNATMRELASFIEMRLGRPVVDETRLEGGHNFTLMWTPGSEEREALPGLSLPPEVREKLRANDPVDGPTLYTALQEQLGLRLERRQVDREITVIDGAKPPTPN